MLKYFRRVFLCLFPVLLLCSCGGTDLISLEGKITGLEHMEGPEYRITIEGRDFVVSGYTYFIDSLTDYLSGEEKTGPDESIVGKYCRVEWRKGTETLLLLDVSGWQQPVFSFTF